MPAVDSRRLRFQIDELMEVFDSPLQFHQRLQNLFSLYANRALRFGDSVPNQPLIPLYNLPQPVIRQLQIDLNRKIQEDSQAALALADELWKDSYLEVKQTAVNILGSLPIDKPDPLLARISDWISPELDGVLATHLFSTGTRRLQDDFLQVWEGFIISFLERKEPKWIALGIKGLSEGLNNPDFKNIPAVFRLVSPVFRNPHPAFMQELRTLISRLAQRSPAETALFLKQAAAMTSAAGTKRLIKDCLDAFPQDLRDDLENALEK